VSLRSRGASSEAARPSSRAQEGELPSASACDAVFQAVKVSGVAPLRSQRHPAHQLRVEPFDPVSRMGAKRQKMKWQGTESASETSGMCVLTNRSSGRVRDKVPLAIAGVRAAQLNR